MKTDYDLADVCDHDWKRHPHSGWAKLLCVRVRNARVIWKHVPSLRFKQPSVWALLNSALGVILPTLALLFKHIGDYRQRSRECQLKIERGYCYLLRNHSGPHQVDWYEDIDVDSCAVEYGDPVNRSVYDCLAGANGGQAQ